MKEINALLLLGIKSTPAMTQEGNLIEKKATPGQYKIQANHVLQQDGTLHKYVEPINVQSEMESLVQWINKNINKKHPCYVASIAQCDRDWMFINIKVNSYFKVPNPLKTSNELKA